MKNWIQKDIRRIVIFVVVLVAVVGITVTAVSMDQERQPTNEMIQGTVNAKEISLNTKIPGRVVEFYVEEGQVVKKGDILVKISSDEIEAKKLQVEAKIAQAQAGVDAAEAVVEMAEGNYNVAKERVEQAQAGVDASESQRDMASAVNDKAVNGARNQQVIQAESAYTLWENTYNRALVLYEGGAISTQKLEEIKTQRDVAAQTLSMAQEGARQEDKDAAAAQLDLTEAGIAASESVLNQAIEASNIAMAQVNQAQAGLTAAQGLLTEAEAALTEVEIYLQDTTLTAPIDGTITNLSVDEGELVSTGTSIATVSDLTDCWVTVNIDETDLAGIEVGQVADITFLAFEGQVFEGKIKTINDQPDFAIKKATSDNGEFDLVSFGIKIELDNQDLTIHPGMTAVVSFE